MIRATTLAIVATTAGMAEGVQIEAAFKNAVSAKVSQLEAAHAAGVENCLNKCQNLFQTMAYSLNVQEGDDTYEYSACRAGCNICNAMLTANEPDLHKCFYTCKQTDWLQNVDLNGDAFPIVKGVIEPDKACIFGCIIGTCQDVCQGGTPEDWSPSNANKWWDSSVAGTGCTIKTGAIRPGGYYSQNSQYSYYNSPNGQGAAAECCGNAYSLCNYNGPKTTTNYNKVIAQAKKHCKGVPGAGNTEASICAWFSDAANCGNPL